MHAIMHANFVSAQQPHMCWHENPQSSVRIASNSHKSAMAAMTFSDCNRDVQGPVMMPTMQPQLRSGVLGRNSILAFFLLGLFRVLLLLYVLPCLRFCSVFRLDAGNMLHNQLFALDHILVIGDVRDRYYSRGSH